MREKDQDPIRNEDELVGRFDKRGGHIAVSYLYFVSTNLPAVCGNSLELTPANLQRPLLSVSTALISD